MFVKLQLMLILMIGVVAQTTTMNLRDPVSARLNFSRLKNSTVDFKSDSVIVQKFFPHATYYSTKNNTVLQTIVDEFNDILLSNDFHHEILCAMVKNAAQMRDLLGSSQIEADKLEEACLPYARDKEYRGPAREVLFVPWNQKTALTYESFTTRNKKTLIAIFPDDEWIDVLLRYFHEVSISLDDKFLLSFDILQDYFRTDFEFVTSRPLDPTISITELEKALDLLGTRVNQYYFTQMRILVAEDLLLKDLGFIADFKRVREYRELSNIACSQAYDWIVQKLGPVPPEILDSYPVLSTKDNEQDIPAQTQKLFLTTLFSVIDHSLGLHRALACFMMSPHYGYGHYEATFGPRPAILGRRGY